MTGRFTVDEAALAAVLPDMPELGSLIERYPVESDHDALLALEAAIIHDEGYQSAAITGPCEIAVDLLTDSDGEIDGWRIIIHPDDTYPDAPWLASSIRRVHYLEPLPEPAEGRGVYDTAAIIRDAVETANAMLDWYEDTIAPPAGLTEAVSAVDGASRELDDVRDAGEDDDAAGSAYQAALEQLAELARTIRNRTAAVLLAAGETAPEPVPEFECCGQWLPRPVPGGPEVRCPRCGDRFVSALPDGWREWTSPEGVSHAVPPSGPCATCGRGRHDNDQED